jgi:hypothetical protein
MEEIAKTIHSIIITESRTNIKYAIGNWRIDMGDLDDKRLKVVSKSERFFLWKFTSENEARKILLILLQSFTMPIGKIEELSKGRGPYIFAFIPSA